MNQRRIFTKSTGRPSTELELAFAKVAGKAPVISKAIEEAEKDRAFAAHRRERQRAQREAEANDQTGEILRNDTGDRAKLIEAGATYIEASDALSGA